MLLALAWRVFYSPERFVAAVTVLALALAFNLIFMVVWCRTEMLASGCFFCFCCCYCCCPLVFFVCSGVVNAIAFLMVGRKKRDSPTFGNEVL